jgi:hypothetical protein
MMEKTVKPTQPWIKTIPINRGSRYMATVPIR